LRVTNRRSSGSSYAWLSTRLINRSTRSRSKCRPACNTLRRPERPGVYVTIADAARKALSALPPQKVTAAVMLRIWSGALGTLGQQRAADLAAVLGGSHAEALRRHFLGLGSRVVDEPKLRSRRGLGNCLPPSGDNADDAKAHEALREALNKVRLGSSGRAPAKS